MSLTTDALTLGAAFAVTVGSAVQFGQAYAELNENTPAGWSFAPFLLIAKMIWSNVLLTVSPDRGIDSLINAVVTFRELGTPPQQVTELSSEQEAMLTVGGETALTSEQAKARSEGKPLPLTQVQISAISAAIRAKRRKEVKRWMGLFIGWLFILIGAVIALVGALLALANDL
jgi:hypothetical protein